MGTDHWLSSEYRQWRDRLCSTIGLKGNVKSKSRAADVTISGSLKGSVYARGKVVITKEAVFNGEINADSISVEDGAS